MKLPTTAVVPIKQSSKKGISLMGYEKPLTKKLKPSHAFIGDVVLFKRKDCFIEGTVVSYRTETVLVEVNSSIARNLGFANNITVVNHKNYEVRWIKGVIICKEI